MTTRIIIFLIIAGYFIWDYRKDKKDFKPFIFPIIGIAFFASTEYYVRLDNRLKLVLLIIAVILTAYYLFRYYKDFKVERFREKKRIRKVRSDMRNREDAKLLEEILEAKNESIRNKSSRYEITMDMKSDYNLDGQMKLFEDEKEELPKYERFYEPEEEKDNNEILENQIGMFEED